MACLGAHAVRVGRTMSNIKITPKSFLRAWRLTSLLFEHYLKIFWYKINPEKQSPEYIVPTPSIWLTELRIHPLSLSLSFWRQLSLLLFFSLTSSAKVLGIGDLIIFFYYLFYFLYFYFIFYFLFFIKLFYFFILFFIFYKIILLFYFLFFFIFL